MCGFAAIFERGGRFDAELLGAMDRDLFHRGPDSGGVLSEEGCALVFRRLAILDPQPVADQPMTDGSGRYTIVFNGEIYNFRELRRALADTGVAFRTEGDTEVILQGFIHWGEAVVDRLEGMYAFVIWDRTARVAHAARDPFGIKPLYVARRGDLTAFASEMRPLRRLVGTELDPAALGELLMYRYAAGRLSNLKNIEMLPGGALARFSVPHGHYGETRFYDVLETLNPARDMSEKDAMAVVEESVTLSVEAHLQSDVGYAVELSGGVDSSLVAAMVARRKSEKLRTFGIHLGNVAEDEARYRRMLDGQYHLDHREVPLSGADFADALPRAVEAMEGPSPHFGCVMLMLLCERIRESDKVVLTGEGADEMFGGYMRYSQWRGLRQKGRVARLVPSFLWPYLQRYRAVQHFAYGDAAIASAVYFDAVALRETFPALVPGPGAREAAASRFSEFRDRMTAVDQTAYLESLLLRQDKMSMAASVEARVPFTHLPLARAVNALPRKLRVPGGVTKPLLKNLAERWLPHDLVHRRKIGLKLPLDEWLTEANGLGRYLDCLTAPDSRLAAYTGRGKLGAAVDSFRAGRRQGLPPLPHLVNMELWLRSLDEPLAPPTAGGTV